MKKAKLIPFTVDVVCPYCNGLAEHPEDGLWWTIDQLIPNKEITCNHCNETFKTPKRVQPVTLPEVSNVST